MRNVLDKSLQKIKTHILYSITFFPENLAVYDIMSKNMVEPKGYQMKSQYGAYALHAGYVRLHARARVLTRTHTDS